MARRKNSRCHICNQTKNQSALCSSFRCKLSFCFSCIKTHFDQEFTPNKYLPNYWICYSCGKSCKCDTCNGSVSVNKKCLMSKKDCLVQKQCQKTIEKQQKKQINESLYNSIQAKIKVQNNSEQIITQLKIDSNRANYEMKQQFTNKLTSNSKKSAFSLINSKNQVLKDEIKANTSIQYNKQVSLYDKHQKRQQNKKQIINITKPQSLLNTNYQINIQKNQNMLYNAQNPKISQYPRIFYQNLNAYQNAQMYYILFYPS